MCMLGRAHGRRLQLFAGGEREPLRADGSAGGGVHRIASVHPAREDQVQQEAEVGRAQADDCGYGPADRVLASQA